MGEARNRLAIQAAVASRIWRDVDTDKLLLLLRARDLHLPVTIDSVIREGLVTPRRRPACGH